MFGLFKKKDPPKPPQEPASRFPPVPDWQPQIVQPLEAIVDRVRYYTDRKRDFAVFTHGTFALLPEGLDDADAQALALRALHGVFHAHPDMHPRAMDDGNVLVTYKNNVASLALDAVTREHWQEIDSRHQQALATHEVLITPLGSNVFDEFGKKALFARCYMFMDAQEPQVVRIVRRDAQA